MLILTAIKLIYYEQSIVPNKPLALLNLKFSHELIKGLALILLFYFLDEFIRLSDTVDLFGGAVLVEQ